MGYRLEIADDKGNEIGYGTKLFGYIPSEGSYECESLKYLWQIKGDEVNQELEEDGETRFEDYEEFVDCICYNTCLSNFIRLNKKELDQFLDLYEEDRKKWSHIFPWEYKPMKDKAKIPPDAEYFWIGWE